MITVLKIVGALFILSGLFDFLTRFKDLTDLLNQGAGPGTGELFSYVSIAGLMFLNPVIAVVVGFGLIKSKLWAVYGLGLFILLRIVLLIWASTEFAITTGNLMIIGIEVLLLIWFYSNKKSFSK